MKVIKRNQIVEDPVAHLADDAPVPETGRFSVSLTRWNAERDALAGTPGLGLRLNGDDLVDDVVADLDAFDWIALEFPKFSDGRCYSHARVLREHHGYRGELRATGDVLRDQLFFMARCGIDVFEVRPDKNIEDALEAFREFSVTYQPAADGRPPVYRRS